MVKLLLAVALLIGAAGSVSGSAAAVELDTAPVTVTSVSGAGGVLGK